MKALNSLLRGCASRGLQFGLTAALLSGASKAAADTLSYTYFSGNLMGTQVAIGGSGSAGFQNGQIDFASGFDGYIQMFDPSLGSLNSVRFTLDADVSVNGVFAYHDYTGQQPQPAGSLSQSLNISPKLNIAFQPFMSCDTSSTSPVMMIPVDGAVNSPLLAHLSESSDFSSAEVLSLLSGPGLIPFDLGGLQRYNYSTFNAQGSPDLPIAVYGLNVIYDFTPVPEPGTMAFGALSAVGLTIFALRSRKK